MKAAHAPRLDYRTHQTLVVDRDTAVVEVRALPDISSVARAGDLWVINDAATLPASLVGSVHSVTVELRLAAWMGGSSFQAVLFGEGSWREDTDARCQPPRTKPGDRIDVAAGLSGFVAEVDPNWPRLVVMVFEPTGDRLWRRIYRAGRAIHYRHLADEFPLAAFQTPYASRPWAMEPASAGLRVTAAALANLRALGATVATVTHAAGLSATGDPALDRRLPFPERYEIPLATAERIADARNRGNRVVAVGTSTVRALEGNFAAFGAIRAGGFVTDLRLGPGYAPRVVDALLTGAHSPESSHYSLLGAFINPALLKRVRKESERAGLLGHEFGDSWMIA